MMRKSLFSCLVAYLFLGCALVNAQRSANTIPEALVGFNLLYWVDDGTHYKTGKLVEQINGIKPKLLRYPAGTASQNYDWQTNSIINTKIFPFKGSGSSELLDTKTFVDICEQTGASGIVVVDITSESLKNRSRGLHPEESGYTVPQPPTDAEMKVMLDKAVAWAKYFKSRNFQPYFYELGNEHYLSFLDYMVMTPEVYAERCLAFIKAIRSVDPDAKFGICGPGWFRSNHHYYKDMEWWPVVLDKLGKDISHIVLHGYWRSKMIVEDKGNEPRYFRLRLDEWGKKNGVKTDDIKIGYTEWGGREMETPEEYSMLVFRFFTDMAKGGLDYATQWPFRWNDRGEFNSASLINRADESKQIAYHVMSAWNKYFTGLEIDNTRLRSIPPDVFTFVARDKSKKATIAYANHGKKTVEVPLQSSRTLRAKQVRIGKEGVREEALTQSVRSISLAPNEIAFVLYH